MLSTNDLRAIVAALVYSQANNSAHAVQIADNILKEVNKTEQEEEAPKVGVRDFESIKADIWKF